MEFNFFFQNARNLIYISKMQQKNNLVVEIFSVVVTAVINLYLGKNIRPSQSTCQVKSLEFHFSLLHSRFSVLLHQVGQKPYQKGK